MTDSDATPDRDGAEMGTSRHAEILTADRHPAIRDNLQWLTYAHLRGSGLHVFSEPFYAAAVDLVLAIPSDSPELTDALKLLVQAKDSAVRAGIKHQQGKAGSVPRPQAVVDPPMVTGAAGLYDGAGRDSGPSLTGPDAFRKAATEQAFGQAD